MKSLLTIKKIIMAILLTSILFVFSYDFYFNEQPEIFYKASVIGKLLYTISISFIASFIFYFMTVHYQIYKDKKIIYKYIDKKLNMIISSNTNIYKEMAKKVDVIISEQYPTQEEFSSICAKIDPHEDAPMVIGLQNNRANWMQFIYYYVNRSNNEIDKILSKIQYLNPLLIEKLVNIEDCTFFSTMRNLQSIPIRSKNMTFISKDLKRYTDLIIDLEEFKSKEMKLYK